MRLVGSVETWEGWLGSHGQQLKIQREVPWLGIPLRCVGSKLMLGSSAYKYQRWKWTQITSSCEKQWGFCLSGRDVWRLREPLKDQSTKFHLQPLTWGPAEGGQSGLEMLEKSLRLVALGRELKEQPPGSLCRVIPHTVEAVFLRQSTPLQVISAWGKVRAPPSPCGA